MEKLQGIGEFVAGLAVAGLGGALLLWGTVSANRADIGNIEEDVDEMREDVRYVRDRLDVLIDRELISYE